MTLSIRFFAGAAAAAGHETEELSLTGPQTLGELVSTLGDRDPALARVLTAASFLVDGVAARPGDVLHDGATLDVLPPFAGG
ncbi:molybdopterin converting factor small subunit [Kineococcus rhizosphaerae]|uniref:Molybdopterin converting factor small subunit n=1 Tax=Kineococcus rhizosphaerae TaxID=559628 RepID=A0A2T0R0R1_9ACTN|nr:molybdopterin converting factor small subunit [Kineococcus rhizosphaerae]